MKWFWVGCLLIITSFYFSVMSLMNLFPIWLSFPSLFLSIYITVHAFNNRHRFKGF
ncbi:hypothetical protein [Salipaludibacillus keqinensis]|nr:hypothetical protein [Salipaludibacillus keqinensis]